MEGQPRTTVLRAAGGAAGMRVDLRKVGEFTVAVLQGEISEQLDGAELGRRLTGEVVLDLSQIERITSFGVKEWLKMLRELRSERLYLVRCSEAVVNQVRMIRSFCGPGRIVSFFAPYICESCGTEFSALYDAIEDAGAIATSRPVPVSCPQCLRLGTFDDEPETYLAVGAQLVEAVPDDLGEVLAQLRSLDGAPIRKAVAGDETWVTFSTRLDGALRLHRVLEGLEGVVVFDLSAVPGTTDEGLDRLLAGIASLGDEVEQVNLVGCPMDLLRMVLDRPGGDPRIGIVSVKAIATCNNPPTRRAIVVTLRAPAIELALRRGANPPVHCDWCSGSLEFGDALHDLGRALDVAPARRVTPAPAQRSGAFTPGPRVTPAPASRFTSPGSPRAGWIAAPAPGVTAPLPVPHGTPAPAEPTPEAPVRGGVPPLLVVAAAVLMGTLVGGAGLIGGMAIVLSSGSAPTVAATAPAPIVAPPEEVLGWTDGLPPVWTEQRFAVGPGRVEIVGGADATTPEAGLELARRDMMRTLFERLASDVGAESELAPISAAGLSDAELDLAIARYEAVTGASGMPERIDGAVRRDTDGIYVVARYALSREAWDRTLETFGASRSFRGMSVSRVLPTQAPGLGADASLVVSSTASWLKAAEPGDVVLAVGRKPVRSLEEYSKALDSTWRRTAPGEWMPIRVRRQGETRDVEFKKPE